MSEDPLWKKIDEHAMKIDALSIQQAEIRTEVRSLERHLNSQMTEMNTVLSRIEGKLDSQAAYQNKQKGALGFGAWLVGGVAAVVTTIALIWNMAFGS